VLGIGDCVLTHNVSEDRWWENVRACRDSMTFPGVDGCIKSPKFYANFSEERRIRRK